MVDNKLSQFAEFELEMLKTWEQEKTFEKSLKQREGQKRFSFYDGPPYANGLPHHGHVVPSTIKDAYGRYKTMQGFYVPRRLGWDTHGLPVEYQIEKELRFKSKRDILEYGIDRFNQACRDSVFRYKAEWERFIERLGRWADAKNAYSTMEDSYIESIWWVFSEIYKKGLVYQDYRSTPYCPRCATPLSNFELNQGYKDNVEDPSLFIKFKLKDKNEFLLAWTTTPWTLPGNAALAVNPTAKYVRIAYTNDEGQTEQLILAKELLGVIDGEYKLSDEFSGRKLVGQSYEPLFKLDLRKIDTAQNLYKVWSADFVSLEEGTGIVHIAPAFGEDDLKHGQAHDIPILQTIDEFGQIKKGVGLDQWAGLGFKAADPELIGYLAKQGSVFASETIRHTYPFCWRCDTPLLYYAVTAWFMDVPKIKKQLLANNRQINWVPKHIGDGRFGNWLEDVREWSISRNRFWGAPIPIWKCGNDHLTVVGSIDELKQQAEKLSQLDMHRPGIDGVKIRCPKCGESATRIEEVFDVWFESGCMPYAHVHYPFENQDMFKEIFPADFIAESIDQTRGWFYTLHVLATALFDKPASKTAVVSGWVVAADGQKLSKRLKNYPAVDEVFEQYGADTLRFFMLTSPVASAEDVRFSSDVLKEVQRNVFMTFWNTFQFFKTYAEVDGWQPPARLAETKSNNILDRWILARLNEVIQEVTKQADAYQIGRAIRPLAGLIDDLSNWYVRRSRRRFWKSEDDKDKQGAYATLHYVLVRICQLLAPWAPFLSDKIYRQLASKTMPESVHLTDWPKAGKVDEDLLEAMSKVQEIVTAGLAQRAEAKIKVRQPLQGVLVRGISLKNSIQFHDIVIDELNVKNIKWTDQGEKKIELDTDIPHELRLEGLAREVIRHVQQYRKELGLNVDDRINLGLQTADGELKAAIKAYSDLISAETLAKLLKLEVGGKAKPGMVEGRKLEIAIAKAGK